jgi:[ribosomal protein S18]-alanine N-acetyltransferase
MEPRFAVRRARSSDIAGILEIETASFGSDAYDRKLFAEYTRTCGELFLVALRGSKVVGYVITCICAGKAELVSIAVHPKVLGNGAAHALMDGILRRLKRRRIGRIVLTVKVTNDRARRFYEIYGFRKLRRAPGYYEDGADGIIMTKDLTGSPPSRAAKRRT